MKLDELRREFVLHFGEMGSRWGINRTVGQIYALLFLSETPLNADDIVEALGFSRSNVSIGLKELQAWELVTLRHYPGDRREYFETPEDLWRIARTLIEQRRKREIDPTLTKLRELQMRASDAAAPDYAARRIAALSEMIEIASRAAHAAATLEGEEVARLLALADRVRAMTRAAGRVLPFSRTRAADGG